MEREKEIKREGGRETKGKGGGGRLAVVADVRGWLGPPPLVAFARSK